MKSSFAYKFHTLIAKHFIYKFVDLFIFRCCFFRYCCLWWSYCFPITTDNTIFFETGNFLHRLRYYKLHSLWRNEWVSEMQSHKFVETWSGILGSNILKIYNGIGRRSELENIYLKLSRNKWMELDSVW